MRSFSYVNKDDYTVTVPVKYIKSVVPSECGKGTVIGTAFCTHFVNRPHEVVQQEIDYAMTVTT